MAERVTILGDGAMATVCAILLRQNGHAVTMWGAFERSIERLMQNREQERLLPGVKVPDEVRLTANDAEAFDAAGLIVNCIPTQYIREVFARLAPHMPSDAPVVSCAKGIEIETLQRPTQVIADVVGDDRPLLVMSGPNIAGELARYLPGAAIVAGGTKEIRQRVQAAFGTEWLRLYTNPDLLGVELAGATKNVIALAAGIVDGLGAGNNAKAALVTRGLVEIERLGVAMGAAPETFAGLAGVGDLIVTCVSPEGRNRTVGERIGKGQTIKQILDDMDSVAEGVPTTKAVRELARRHNVEMPITEGIYAVLYEERDVLEVLSGLMSRDPKAEFE
ncbi:MAG: NAD(P)H-dependent glycerol-3-phosphate dehydrogenase [Planctomycetota bacterium]